MNNNNDDQPVAETKRTGGSRMTDADALETSLIADTASGDVSAFEQLYQLYYQRLFRFINRVTGRLDLIEEIINDVFYLVWQKAKTFNRSSRPSSWIFGIAYNKSLSHCRQTKQQAAEILIEDIDDRLMPGNARWLKQLENENWLEVSLQRLSADHRTVLELTYWQGMHYKDIAKIMRCSENTVKTRMFYARKRLASALQKHQ